MASFRFTYDGDNDEKFLIQLLIEYVKVHFRNIEAVRLDSETGTQLFFVVIPTQLIWPN